MSEIGILDLAAIKHLRIALETERGSQWEFHIKQALQLLYTKDDPTIEELAIQPIDHCEDLSAASNCE